MIAFVPARRVVPRAATRLVLAVFVAVLAVAALFDVARALAAARHSRSASSLSQVRWSDAPARGAGSGSKTACE